MSIMAKTPSGYKKIGSAYLGERPVDKVFNANGDVVYALQRELTGVPPLLFKGKEQSDLLNYRIYGDTVDGNSVGDLVESGEHTGEYKVDVTVEGKNLAKNNYSDSSAMFTVEEVNNFIHVSGANNSGSTKAYVISKENVFPAGSYDIVNNSDTVIMYDYKNENNVLVSENVNANSIKTFNFPAVFTRKLNVFKSVSNGNSIDNYFQVMIVKHGDDTDTYEPYHAPVTTPIYLPEQIKMVGDEAEYVDYAEQKQHRVRKNLWSGIVEQGNVSTSGTYADDIKRIRSKNVPIKPGAYTISCNLAIRCIYAYNNNEKVSCVVDNGGRAIYSNTFTVPSDANNVSIGLRSFDARGAEIDVTTSDFEWGQIEKGSEVTTYEPYIENTDLDVTLPALPTLTGTNVLSVDAEVQPSRMDIKGRIKSLT